MKVIHLDTGRDWRGGQSQVLMLSQGLLAKDCDSLIVAKKGSALGRRAREQGVPVQELPLRFEADIGSAARLKKIAAAETGAIVHAHTPHALGIALLARGLGLAFPILFTRRVSFPIKRTTVNRWKINRADSIIAVSRAALNEMASAGIDPAKMRVIHSAFDQKAFPFHGPSLQSPLNIAVLGTLEKAKGMDQALRLAGAVDDLPLLFHFFGGGPDSQALQRAARRKRNIVPHGFIQEVGSLLQTMYAAVTCSPSEGFPNLVMQSMATGLPVIALENTAIREMIVSDEVGFVAATVEEAIARLRTLSVDTALAQRMGRSASEWVCSQFTVEKMVEQNLEVYRQVLTCE